MNAKERKDAAEKLSALRAQLMDAVEAYNDLTVDMDDIVQEFVRERMGEAREEVTRLASELADAAADVSNQMREYINEKSEKWQESDAGQAWESVCDALENASSLDDLTDDTISVDVTVEDLDATDVDDLSNVIEELEEL